MELQIFIEHLLHARLLSKHKEYSSSSCKKTSSPYLHKPQRELGKKRESGSKEERKGGRGGGGGRNWPRRGEGKSQKGNGAGGGSHSPCCLVPSSLSHHREELALQGRRRNSKILG